MPTQKDVPTSMQLEHFTDLDLVHHRCNFYMRAMQNHTERSLRALLAKITLVYRCIGIAIQHRIFLNPSVSKPTYAYLYGRAPHGQYTKALGSSSIHIINQEL